MRRAKGRVLAGLHGLSDLGPRAQIVQWAHVPLSRVGPVSVAAPVEGNVSSSAYKELSRVLVSRRLTSWYQVQGCLLPCMGCNDQQQLLANACHQCWWRISQRRQRRQCPGHVRCDGHGAEDRVQGKLAEWTPACCSRIQTAKVVTPQEGSSNRQECRARVRPEPGIVSRISRSCPDNTETQATADPMVHCAHLLPAKPCAEAMMPTLAAVVALSSPPPTTTSMLHASAADGWLGSRLCALWSSVNAPELFASRSWRSRFMISSHRSGFAGAVHQTQAANTFAVVPQLMRSWHVFLFAACGAALALEPPANTVYYIAAVS